MNDTSKKVIFLMGATATGKTDLAVELVERFPLDIISVDSALIYREMDIGTAKPDTATLAKAPHRLIDILDPSESWSVAEFYEAAIREIQDIHAQGRMPILVGGTMMYFRALQTGLAELPPADEEVRAELEAQANKIGWDGMHAVLAQVDPASAARIHPNDPQRIQRALEVFRLTGQTLGSLLAASAQEAFPFEILSLILGPEDRRDLDDRIAARFVRMLEQGFVAEVERLRQRGDLSIDLPSMRSVGYRQVWEYLEGNISETEMREQAIRATEQLAKRQYTWLRSEISRARESGQRCEWLKNNQGEALSDLLALVDKYMASQGKFC